jgi:hypothetical protein
LSQAPRVTRFWPALLLTLPAPARAEPAEEAVRFQYQAPAECPDLASFTARVRERTERGREPEEAELARTFSVSLRPEGHGFVGEIEFLDDGGSKVSRRVRGEQCEAVVSSLALITALALDATLRHEEEPAAPVPIAPRPPTPAPVVAPPQETAPVFRAPPTPRSLTGMRVGVTGGLASAIHAPVLGLLGQLDWRSGVALRLTAYYGWDELEVDEGRRARLRAQGVQVSVCPLRWGGARLGVAPCGFVDLGTLRSEGVRAERLISAGGDTILWATVGAELRLAWEPAAPFWLELKGAAELPLRRGYRFTFDRPDRDVYEVPDYAGSLALAAGVRFW